MNLMASTSKAVNTSTYLNVRALLALLLIANLTNFANANGPPNVVANKDVSNANPIVGDTLDYTLTILNKGKETAYYIQIVDPLLPEIYYVPQSITGGNDRDDSDAAGNGLVWTIDTLEPGESVVLAYKATVGVQSF